MFLSAAPHGRVHRAVSWGRILRKISECYIELKPCSLLCAKEPSGLNPCLPILPHPPSRVSLTRDWLGTVTWARPHLGVSVPLAQLQPL